MNAKTRTKALIGVAAAIAAYVLFSPENAQTIEAAKVTATAKSGTEPRASRAIEQNVTHTLFQLAHRVTVGSSSDSLFAAHSWFVPPPLPRAPDPAPSARDLTPRLPTAPPLPFAYIGSLRPDGSAPVFFLMQGDRVYDVRVGDTLDDTYSVDGFDDDKIVMTYKPLNIQQRLFVGVGP